MSSIIKKRRTTTYKPNIEPFYAEKFKDDNFDLSGKIYSYLEFTDNILFRLHWKIWQQETQLWFYAYAVFW